jgi:hypothetical protein
MSSKHQLLFFIFFAFCSLSAQNIAWVKTFPQSNPANPAYNHEPLGLLANGTFWTGRLENRHASYNQQLLGDYKLYRMDLAGNRLDSVTATGNASVLGLAVHGNNTIALYGYLDSIMVAGQSFHFGNEYRQLLVHIDSAGQERLLWEQDDSIASMTVTPLGEILVASTAGFGGTVEITRLDTAGNVLASRSIPGLGYIRQISQAKDGSIVLSGGCSSQTLQIDSVSMSHNFGYSAYVLMMDPTMTAIWGQVIEDVTCANVRHYCAGRSATCIAGPVFIGTPIFGNLSYTGPNSTNQDFYLTQLDSAGVFEWVVEVPGDTGIAKVLPASRAPVDMDAEGNVYFLAEQDGSSSIFWDTSFITTASMSGKEILLMSFTSSGDLRWAYTMGSTSSDFANSLKVLGKDSLLFTGTIADTARFGSLAISGKPGTEFVALLLPPAPQVSRDVSRSTTIKVWPVPGLDVLNVRWGTETVFGEMELYDLTGRQLPLRILSADVRQMRLDIGHLAPGVYLLRRSGTGEAVRFLKG